MRRPAHAVLLAALTAVPAAAQQRLMTRRSDLPVKVYLQGTVVAADVIRLKAEIDGRVEQFIQKSNTWVVDGKPLGFLANREMAAIHDSHTTTVQGVVEERWRRVYAPTPVRCPGDCFVLRVFAKQKEWLKPRSLLAEAAMKLQLVGRVRPEDAHWPKEGQVVEFWDVRDPSRKQRARISRYNLDIQGHKVLPGGTLTVDLSPGAYLEPGTKWEGIVIPEVRKDVVIAPTEALIYFNGEVFLPVRVSTGASTASLTEITAGVDDKRPILVLDDAALKEAARFKGQANPTALRRRIEEEYYKRFDKPLPSDDLPQVIEPGGRRGSTDDRLADPDATYSESPYSQ